MTERDGLYSLAGAYALDALEQHEIASFEAFLAESEEVRTEVGELMDTAVMLGLATRPIEPPPALKTRIMAELMNRPQLAPISSDADADAAHSSLATVTSIGSTPLSAVPALDTAPNRDQARRIRHAASGKPASSAARSRWFTRPASILVAVAAAAGLFFAGTATGVGFAPGDSQAASFTELFAAPDLQHQASPVAGGGDATLMWSDQLDRAAVVVKNLPALADGRTYELWYIDASGAKPAGTFDAAASGSTVRVLDGKMQPRQSVGITVEPSGGSKVPTTDPILVIQGA